MTFRIWEGVGVVVLSCRSVRTRGYGESIGVLTFPPTHIVLLPLPGGRAVMLPVPVVELPPTVVVPVKPPLGVGPVALPLGVGDRPLAPPADSPPALGKALALLRAEVLVVPSPPAEAASGAPRELEVERRRARLRNMTCIFWGSITFEGPVLRPARPGGSAVASEAALGPGPGVMMHVVREMRASVGT